jgi:lambda family phage tail tape measure protein
VLARKNLTDAIKKEIELDRKQVNQWAKNTVAAANYDRVMQDKLKTEKEAIALKVASIGMGGRQIAMQHQLLQIAKEANDQREQLERDRENHNLSDEIYQHRLKSISDFERERAQLVRDGDAEELAAMGDWKNGVKSAYADILVSAGDVAGQTRYMFTNAFDGMTDALANFVTTGKLDFKSLATSILADLAKMEMRIAASKALAALIEGFSGGGSVAANANGGVYTSASLSAFSGQIVDKPTMFAFAKGAGLMGEAGPEAILPLQRGPDGKLGVRSGGAGGGVNVVQNITIENGNASTSTDTSGNQNDIARQFADRMKQTSRETIAQEMRPGGLLWRMQHSGVG